MRLTLLTRVLLGAFFLLLLPQWVAAGRDATPDAGGASARPYAITDLGVGDADLGIATVINNRGQAAGDILFFQGGVIHHAALWQDGTMIDLGTLGGSFSFVAPGHKAMNDRGQVVGYSETPTHAVHAFLWQDGTMTDLGTLAGPAGSSYANAINQRGQVVGSSTAANGERHAFLWEDGVMIDLGISGFFNVALAINEHGQVAGSGYNDHAFVWEKGLATDLGSVDGSLSSANSINERGQVVGETSTGSGDVHWIHGFLWQHGLMTDLGTTEGGISSGATRVNERGQVIGSSVLPNGARAFLWQDGLVTDLGTLGGPYSFPYAINERGQVVGKSRTESDVLRAFLWQDGVMTDLGTLDGTGVSAALDINERGDIVGESQARNGVGHPCLWRIGKDAHAAVTRGPHADPGAGVGGVSTVLAPLSSALVLERSAPALRVTSPPGAVPVEFELRGLPAGPYRASVFDARGRLVRRWEGYGTVATWDGRSDGGRASAGMYFLRVEAQGQQMNAKVLVAR